MDKIQLSLTDRDRIIRQMDKENYSYVDIATRFGLSRERVRQIVLDEKYKATRRKLSTPLSEMLDKKT
jgi:DNA-directed RNA polymerase sigma subunit (sigma70/sigma32)